MYHMSMRGDAAKSVNCYAEAQRNLASAQLTPTGRAKRMTDYGWECGSSVTRIRQSGDRIIFRLYQTDVVTWYPDESFEIGNWDSQLTAQFIRQFTPISASGNKTLMFHRAPRPAETGNRDADWAKLREFWGTQRVVRGDVRFVLEDGLHVPDLDTCDTFRSVRVTDRKATRQAAAEHHIAEFKRWLFMALPMLDLQHESEDLGECADALKEKRFRDAARHLPTCELSRGFGLRDRAIPLKIGGVRRDQPVTMTSVERVRDYIYDMEGLLEIVETKELGRGDLDRWTQRNAAYAKAEVGDYRLGWSGY